MQTARVAGAVVATALLGTVLGLSSPGEARVESSAPARTAASAPAFASSFEENRGQAPAPITHVVRAGGSTTMIHPTGLVAVVRTSAPNRAGDPSEVSVAAAGDVVTVATNFAGANAHPVVRGEEPLATVTNVCRGTPEQWITGIPHVARVRAEDVYPGIDVEYSTPAGGGVRYDLHVDAGADPRVVELAMEGVARVEIDADGALVASVGEARIRQTAPVAWQDLPDGRRAVDVAFEPRAEGRFGFHVGDYDRSVALVIDPTVLLYCLMWGGDAYDATHAIAVDGLGHAYMAGETTSTNVPFTFGALVGGSDAVVAKTNPGGTAFLWLTVLGGPGLDSARSIAVDANGDAHVTGICQVGYPVTPGAFQVAFGGVADAFETMLPNAGGVPIYSTFLGGAGLDQGNGIAVGPQNTAYVTGETNSVAFPVTVGSFQGALAGQMDAFVTQVAAGGAALAYSTYLGGVAGDSGRAIVVNAVGVAIVDGVTSSGGPVGAFPTTMGAVQPAYAGGAADLFVSGLTPNGAILAWSTFWGTPGADYTYSGIGLDQMGTIHIGGATNSAALPVTAGCYQAAHGGGVYDGFYARLFAGGAGTLYATYLGGGGDDFVLCTNGLGLGAGYVSGQTNSVNFPVVVPVGVPYQAVNNGGIDAFVASFVGVGAPVVSATYFGSLGDDFGEAVDVDANGDIYLGGMTQYQPGTAPAFPATAGWMGLPPNPPHGFVAKLR